MIKFFILILVIICFIENNITTAQNVQKKIISLNNSNINYKIISAINNTWGYDVFINDKLIIHQTTIPSLPGNEGFKTKKAAENTAKLVVFKINKGVMPPTITIQELKSIKAI